MIFFRRERRPHLYTSEVNDAIALPDPQTLLLDGKKDSPIEGEAENGRENEKEIRETENLQRRTMSNDEDGIRKYRRIRSLRQLNEQEDKGEVRLKREVKSMHAYFPR